MDRIILVLKILFILSSQIQLIGKKGFRGGKSPGRSALPAAKLHGSLGGRVEGMPQLAVAQPGR